MANLTKKNNLFNNLEKENKRFVCALDVANMVIWPVTRNVMAGKLLANRVGERVMDQNVVKVRILRIHFRK